MRYKYGDILQQSFAKVIDFAYEEADHLRSKIRPRLLTFRIHRLDPQSGTHQRTRDDGFPGNETRAP